MMAAWDAQQHPVKKRIIAAGKIVAAWYEQQHPARKKVLPLAKLWQHGTHSSIP